MTKPEVVGWQIFSSVGDVVDFTIWRARDEKFVDRLMQFCEPKPRIEALIRLSDYEALAEELDRQSVITGDYIARAQRMGDENAELRAELQTERDRYFREVYGLNNEGDPIGGDPAGGYVNQIAELRAANDKLDRLASARAAENERLGRRVHELEVEIRRLRKYEHPRGMKPYKQQAEELRRSLLTAEDKIRYRDEVIDQRNGEIDRLFADLAGALDLLRECAPILSGVGYHERRKRIDAALSQQAKP